jgi:sugar porter (SP) family MFS transporter
LWICECRDTGEEINYWACDCFAPDQDREPSGWLEDKGLFVSLLSFGAMVGALSAGQLSEILGRRKCISIVSAVFVLGTLICCIAGSLTTLLLGRVLIGFPIGALSAVLPMYATEIAPKQIRGLLGTLFQLAIVVGILLATVIAIPVEEMVNGWIFALGIAAVPASALSLGIWRFPESPRWLLIHVDETAASTALQTLRAQSAAEVGPELREMVEAIASAPKASGYKDLLEPRIMHRLRLGVGLQILQQATGVNAIFYFAPTIFKDAKIHNALLCAAATGLANLGGQLLAMRLVEEKGRRTLLLWGAGGMALCMGMAGMLLVGETGGFTGVLTGCFYQRCFSCLMKCVPRCLQATSQFFSSVCSSSTSPTPGDQCAGYTPPKYARLTPV